MQISLPAQAATPDVSLAPPPPAEPAPAPAAPQEPARTLRCGGGLASALPFLGFGLAGLRRRRRA